LTGSAEYDAVAEAYRRNKEAPWRVILERPTVEQLLGDVRGESLLDLACGEGHYARLAADRGASPVCAVDISAEMIALAEQEERERPRGVHYHCVPAERFEPAGVNDVVLAVYLLNCARDAVQLDAFCSTFARCLRPGGRLVCLYGQLDSAFGAPLEEFGIRLHHQHALAEGEPYEVMLFDGARWFSITDYAWSMTRIEQALRQVGFEDLRWHLPIFGEALPPKQRALLEHYPIFRGLSARLGSSAGDVSKRS